MSPMPAGVCWLVGTGLLALSWPVAGSRHSIFPVPPIQTAPSVYVAMAWTPPLAGAATSRALDRSEAGENQVPALVVNQTPPEVASRAPPAWFTPALATTAPVDPSS